jgi:hypothetical protein
MADQQLQSTQIDPAVYSQLLNGGTDINNLQAQTAYQQQMAKAIQGMGNQSNPGGVQSFRNSVGGTTITKGNPLGYAVQAAGQIAQGMAAQKGLTNAQQENAIKNAQNNVVMAQIIRSQQGQGQNPQMSQSPDPTTADATAGY